MQASFLVDLIYWGFEKNLDQSKDLLTLLNALVAKFGQGIICASLSNRKPLCKVLGEGENYFLQVLYILTD